MAEMAQSMKEHGVLKPLIVAPGLEEEAGVVLIAGYRRLAAARLAKLPTVATIFRPDLDSEAKQVIAMLIENGQRAALSAIEEARSSLDAARFVVAAMWEFLAEAYDWGRTSWPSSPT